MRFFYPRNRAIVMFIITFLLISIFCLEAEAKFINTFLYRIAVMDYAPAMKLIWPSIQSSSAINFITMTSAETPGRQ